MISLVDMSKVRRVLCFGAHSDDIEIGCGGTILRLVEANPQLEITWVVFGGNEQRQSEARASAESFLAGIPAKNIITKNFRDAFFPFQGEAIKEFVEEVKRFCPAPDLIFTHYRDDLHQDHRTINQFTWNAFRSHLICEYEIVKYDSDLGHPNLFSPLSEATVDRKISLLMKHFASQQRKQWYDEETFRGYMRIRGVQCDSATKYAEAFHLRKMIL
jgi:LmbE family N-acetylglucosaminyl deacetylase